jgi:PAS domain S-box-containing protein
MKAAAVVQSAWNRHWAYRYGLAVAIFALAAASRLFLEARYGVTPPYLTFYPATMLAAIVCGPWPGVLTTVLSAAFAEIFLLQPRGQIAIAHPQDAVALGVYVAMGLLICAMAGALQRTGERERRLIAQALRDSEDRFRLVVTGVKDYAIFVLDPQGRVATWNSSAQRIKGWSAEEIIGQNFSLLFPEEAVRNGLPMEILKRAAIEGSFQEEAERVRKDGSRFWADVAMTALRDASGNLSGYVKIVRDISERKQAIREMAESRSRLAGVVDSAMDAIITVDEEQHVVLFNTAAEAMFGCPAGEALGGPLAQFIPQRFREVHAGHVRSFADTGVTSRAMGKLGTLYGVKRSGEEFPIEASISQASVDGRTLFTVILRDITERKRAEEHQSLLLSELVHRVKNTLSVVQSIAAQTHHFTAAERFYDTFAGRLAALGAAHDLLTRTEWEGAGLADVIRCGLEPYSGFATVERWTMDGPAIWLAPNEAVTLSLAFHELTTNAAKYGALSDVNGTVTVRWHLRPDGKPTELAIHWREHGGPIVVTPSRRGFGSRLLERAIAHELGGETQMQFDPAGAACRFRIPLSPRIRMKP